MYDTKSVVLSYMCEFHQEYLRSTEVTSRMFGANLS